MTGEQIRQLRERLGWTQSRMGEIVAEGLGRERKIGATTIGRWETGEREPAADVLAFLAALDGTPPELFEQLAEETPPPAGGLDETPDGGTAPRRRRVPKTEELVVASSGAYAKICTELFQIIATGVGMVGAAIGSPAVQRDGLIIHEDSAQLGEAYGKLAETNETFRNFLTAGEKHGALLAVGVATGSTISRLYANHAYSIKQRDLYVVDGYPAEPAQPAAAEPGPLA